MAIRFPAIAHAKQILRRSNLLPNQSASNFTDVPKGYLAVYVGEDQKKRFIVPVSLLNKPSFQELLRKAEEEFGFNHPMGGITIPCREDIFIDLTSGEDPHKYLKEFHVVLSRPNLWIRPALRPEPA
ncbi:auxin-responsive protein SAUR21-like [Hevea brasiliensis]|uniref:auxin-responsive protein SAUR21-like n=1 Tax=Hevea brasiliensis TaxID=3981 RepID=UPI0025DCAFA6|nr:auxin-responsive protein SAUR21-like [Hevea brasiliensis]